MNLTSIILFLLTLPCLSISSMAQTGIDTNQFQAKAPANHANPERIQVLAPGQPYILKPLKKK